MPIIAVILFVLPLTFFPWANLSFELPKVLVFYILSAILLAKFSLTRYKLHKINLTHFLAIFFYLWLVLVSILGANFEHSLWGNYFRMQGIITWTCYLLIFIVSGLSLAHHQSRYQVALAITVSAAFVASLGNAQFISFWFWGHSTQLLYDGRIISTFGQPNFLGAFLVSSLPFFWYLISVTRQKEYKLFLWIGMVLTAIAIVFTFSRSAWLAFLALSLIWGFYHKKLLLGLVVGLLVMYTVLANMFPLLAYREWRRFEVDLSHKWTGENRSLIAMRSADLIANRPITGWGADNFILAFPQVIRRDDLGLKDIVVDSAHNIFLDLGVETGLVGLAIFTALVGSIFGMGLVKTRKLEDEQKVFNSSLIMATLVFLISHQFSVLSVVPFVIFWISAGGIAGPVFEAVGGTHPVLKQEITRGVTVFVILSATWFGVQNIRADIIFKKASFYEVSNIHKAISLNNKAITVAPWVQFYVWRRDFLLRQLGY